MSKFDQNPVGGICSTGIRSPILSILDLNRDGSMGGEERPVHSENDDQKDDSDDDVDDDDDIDDAGKELEMGGEGLLILLKIMMKMLMMRVIV